MRKNSILGVWDYFGCAALIAAHSASPLGFRQKDVRFYFELFVNWFDSMLEQDRNHALVHNTQFQRLVRHSLREGYLRSSRGKLNATYKLTRPGLLEMLSQMRARVPSIHPTPFVFVCFFISQYRARIEELVANEGTQYPRTLKLEIDALLQTDDLVERQILALQKMESRLQTRIEDATKILEIMREGQGNQESIESLIQKIQKEVPYELNNQKPLAKLMNEMPVALRESEFTSGTSKRVEWIWAPHLDLLQKWRASLQTRSKVL